jgi:hypothetical protein
MNLEEHRCENLKLSSLRLTDTECSFKKNPVAGEREYYSPRNLKSFCSTLCILMLSFILQLGFKSVLLSSGFPTEIFYEYLTYDTQ